MFEADKEGSSDFTRKLSRFMVVGFRHLRNMPQEESDVIAHSVLGHQWRASF